MPAIERTPVSTRERTAMHKPRITVAQLVLRAVGRWQRKRAISELSLLDDRQLRDIGISRSEIPRAVKGLFGPDELRAESRPKKAAPGNRGIAATSYPRAA